MSASMRERLYSGLGVTDGQVYDTPGLMDMADLREIADLDRPELKHEPWIPVTRARLADPEASGDLFARIRADDLLVHLPYESFVDLGRGVRARRVQGPGRRRRQDHRLPHVRRHGAAPGPDRGGRAGQAGGVPGRAEGSVRRAPEHRVVAGDGAGRRACRPRLPRPEDPREDDARDPARGRRAASVRAHRHGELQRGHRPPLRGSWPLHRRRGDHGRRRRSLQPHDGVRTAAAVPEAPRRTVQPAHAPHRPHPLGCRRGRLGPDGEGPDEGQLAHRSRDHRGALPRVSGRRPRSTSSPARSARSVPASRACRSGSTCARSPAAFSSTAASSRSRPATRPPTCSGAPTSCRATSTTGSRSLDAGRGRPPPHEISTIFDSAFADTRPRGSSLRTEPGRDGNAARRSARTAISSTCSGGRARAHAGRAARGASDQTRGR